ncbi:MAG TPA: 4-hydroxy-tetrahydrodipicolinate reductase [Candidatus Eisenbacteria bacterium]|nr:4-hydroxy-tetrahydrodipicolinate reductase [Candidatus Eisenbacteria bacterium]
MTAPGQRGDPVRLVLVGAAGRMGRAVAEAAGGDTAFRIEAFVDQGAATGPGRWVPDAGEAIVAGSVVIEFSAPAASVRVAGLCAERGAALVSGTTGLTGEQEALVQAAASRTPVLRAANFSLGVVALRRAVAAALAALPGWDVEIVERHHRRKADSPSGTALALARQVLAARGWGEQALRHGRQGHLGPRPDAEVGVHALRGGGLVGDHTVVLAGPGEWLELRHVAQDRGAFAHGALAAARFVADAPAGFYTLEDVVTPPAG